MTAALLKPKQQAGTAPNPRPATAQQHSNKPKLL